MRLMILSPTKAFEGREEIEFEIIERIAHFFDISVRSVHSCGSAKLGFSPVKGSEFVDAESDLDIAIIDHDCFIKHVGAVISATNQYRVLTGFPRNADGQSTYNSFIKYLAKGIFRPDLMPIGDIRKDWFSFFNKLSNSYRSVFSNISAGIYLSDTAFQLKQSDVIKSYGQLGGRDHL